MLKKKNIAMMTAAITAASAVTPAFAATVNRAIVEASDMADADQRQEVMDTVKKYLETTYTTDKEQLVDEDLAGKTAYNVVISGKIEGVTPSTTTVSTVGEFEVLMSKIQKDDTATITVTNKGHRKLEDGTIVDWDNYTFERVRRGTNATSKATLQALVDFKLADINNEAIKVKGNRVTTAHLLTTSNGTLTGNGAEVTINENTTTFDISGNGASTTGAILTVKGSEPSKDFTKPIYSEEGFIVNFEIAREKIVDVEGTKLTKTIDIVCTEDVNANAEKVTIDAATLVEEGRLTVAGNELKNKILELGSLKLTNEFGKEVGLVSTKEATTGSVVNVKEDVTVTAPTMYQTTNTTVTYVDSKTSKFTVTVTPDLGYAYSAGYKLTATPGTVAAGVEVTTASVLFDQSPIAVITIEGNHDVVKKAYDSVMNGTVAVETLAGQDRYKTAVNVSKKGWDGTTSTTDTVVLVSGEALADGLAATPYAAKLNAPILLTQKGELNADTKAEIIRLGAKNVHIIGGTAAVEEAVAKELGKMGVNVTRIAGEDRFETSLEVAKRLTTTDTVYVAQGDAMADALSISAVAGQTGSPILLTGKDSMSKDIKKFISDKNVTNAYVIGGDAVIEKSVVAELNKLAGDVKVLGGTDRFDTNAKIIDEFYTANKAEEVMIVNGDKGLVDALSAGAYAGKTTSNAVLVLAGDDLSTSQKVEIKDNVNHDGVATGNVKTQIGYNVASKVIATLRGLLK